MHTTFLSNLNSSVTDFGYYSVLLISDKMSIIFALWSSYSLQSQKICSSVCSPSPHSHSAVDTTLNLLRLVWPALIRFIDTKSRRFIFISRNHVTSHSCSTLGPDTRKALPFLFFLSLLICVCCCRKTGDYSEVNRH
jgi:hypothetical protein